MALVGRDLKDHLCPTPCDMHGHQALNQAIDQLLRVPSNLTLYIFRTGHPQHVPAPHHSLSKKLLPDVQSKSSLL